MGHSPRDWVKQVLKETLMIKTMVEERGFINDTGADNFYLEVEAYERPYKDDGLLISLSLSDGYHSISLHKEESVENLKKVLETCLIRIEDAKKDAEEWRDSLKDKEEEGEVSE